MNPYPFLSTLVVISIAELGDKTQLLTLGFSTRYPFWEVISAVFCATAALMMIAVFFGGIIYYYLPVFYVQLFAALLFIFFGLWTILGEEKEEERGQEKDWNPFCIIFLAFFLAELGDKTQLATLALSARYGTPIQVWLGATLGMAGANVLSVLAGRWTKRIVSEKAIKYLGAAVFIGFGLLTLGELFLW